MLESLGQHVDGRRSSQQLFGRVLEKAVDGDQICYYLVYVDLLGGGSSPEEGGQ